MGTFTLIRKKIIDHLPDSAEGKAKYSLHRWVGIDTQRDDMHCKTCNVNLCMLFYHLFHSDAEIVITEDYISTRFKGLKIQKNAKFCT